MFWSIGPSLTKFQFPLRGKMTVIRSKLNITKDFSINQDWKYLMKCCLIQKMLGCFYAHLALEVGLRDLDN